MLTHLKEITFGNEPSLTTIEGYAFCYSIISKFTIPSTVVTINERAFSTHN